MLTYADVCWCTLTYAGALPPTADILFLEYCYENCEELRFDAGGGAAKPLLARAASPGCVAAVFLTAKGAQKVFSSCIADVC
jgi:hypothetical protein